MEEVKEVYKQLSKENKDVLNLLAKGMEIAQNQGVNKNDSK